MTAPSQTGGRIVVLASGNGSNFQAVQQACQRGEIAGQIVQVITDRADAYVIRRAEQAAIPLTLLAPKQFNSRAEHDQALCQLIASANPDLILLAGDSSRI